MKFGLQRILQFLALPLLKLVNMDRSQIMKFWLDEADKYYKNYNEQLNYICQYGDLTSCIDNYNHKTQEVLDKISDKNTKDQLSSAIKELFEETQSKSIEDMGGNGRERKIDNVDDLKSVLLVIYRVRSNLFHASKDPNDKRDSRLIKYSFIAIYLITKYLP
jgi:hypothetical protein